MKEIIKWLREVEHLACEMYLHAALMYANDISLNTFLQKNAEEEAWHYHVMGSAALFLNSEPNYVSAISVDKETGDRIVQQIIDITEGIDRKTLSREEVIDKIVELELSEWNDIFIYALDYLKDKSSEFKYPAIRIQAHIKAIEYYLSTIDKRPLSLERIKELPPVWIENILIVDDEEIVANLIKAMICRSGNIDIAQNGQEALELMETKYYKLIVSDIDMPIMDGLTFYKKAVDKYPAINNRFLFMTGDLSPERQAFFREKHLKCLAKPMEINVLMNETEQILISK